jgi:MFS family permease
METYTTDDALTKMGFGRSQALVLVYAGMGWVAEAMELMLLSFLGPFVREQWNISPQNESMLSSFVFAGMLIGACAWGFVSDKYGRRYGSHPTNTFMFQFSTTNLSDLYHNLKLTISALKAQHTHF